MRKSIVAGFMMLLVCVFFISAVHAEEVMYKFGASERIRQEIWDNLLDLKTLPPTNTNYDRNFFRFKTSLWGNADFNKDTGLFLKLTSEIYYNLGPYKQISKSRSSGFTRLDENEGIIDNLYLKANNLFGLPVDLKIGRQDFLGPDMYGEGFLLSDGNPNDGSRSFYFNAAKLKWRINENHNIDFVYIVDQFEDKFLPTWHTSVPDGGTYYNHKKILNACDEQAYMVYGRDKLNENLTVEPYYIFKKEKQQPLGTKTSALDLNTFGARAVYTSNPWKFGGEFAYQVGEYDDAVKDVSGYAGQDRQGYGGYIFGSRKFADMKFKPEFELRFVYLSGDDPETSKNENFDPLFSRQPYWNELLIYVQIYEFIKNAYAIPGYWSNSQLYMAKVRMELSPDTNLALSYQYWRANEWAQPLSRQSAMFAHGYDRGHLPTLFLTHKFNKNVDAFFQYEYFIPGDFYASDAKNGQFLRWQLQFKI
jgi:Alginate export